MNCPHCNVTLVMTDKHGIEIDYCPQCRGVWLDRGELDKIIERSVPYQGGYENRDNSHHDSHHEKHHDYYKNDHHSYGKKSFLRELFD
jgi:uncharacterized protein